MNPLRSDEILRLSAAEHLRLTGQLCDSFEQRHVPVSQTQQRELELRMPPDDECRQTGVTWAALKAELKRRC